MPPRFIYLENNGSPTRWDGTRYFEYLSTARAGFPVDLQSLTQEGRYDLPSSSELSIWRSSVTRIVAEAGQIHVDATNDYGTRRFEFRYSGVRKFQTTATTLWHMPTIVVQELVMLRGGLLRHSFSDMGGAITTIHASSLSFREDVVQ